MRWRISSPDAYHLLRDDLYVHLDEADSLAHMNDEWPADDMDTARGLMGNPVLVIRGLLIEHALQTGGDCRIFTSAWPRPVVTTIHALIKDPQRQFVALVLRVREDD
jgi:hypothetical protein